METVEFKIKIAKMQNSIDVLLSNSRIDIVEITNQRAIMNKTGLEHGELK